MNLTKRYTILVSLIAFMKSITSTSIMNNVHIAKGELNPPTVFNRSSSNSNLTKDEGQLGYVLDSNELIPNGHDKENVPDINRPLPKNNEIIGSSLLDLSGISDVDNVETILGDTVADAFLMNSWDDAEIRYGKFSVISKWPSKAYSVLIHIYHFSLIDELINFICFICTA